MLEGGCAVNTSLWSRTCDQLLSTHTLTACGGLEIRRQPSGPPGKLREPASPPPKSATNTLDRTRAAAHKRPRARARARHGGNDALGRDAKNAGSEVSTQSGSSLADERRGWAGLRPRWGGGGSERAGARRLGRAVPAGQPSGRACAEPGGRLVPAPAHHAAPPAAHRGLGREHQRLLVDAGHLRRALHDDSDAGQGQRHEPLFPALVLTHGRVRHLLRPGGP